MGRWEPNARGRLEQAALELFGSTREELLTQDVFDIYVHAADRERFQDQVRRTGFVRDHEVRLARRDGTLVDCLLSATLRLAGIAHTSIYEE